MTAIISPTTASPVIVWPLLPDKKAESENAVLLAKLKAAGLD